MSLEPELDGPPDHAELAFLRLLHLADSALPIGTLAHSFGLESLTAAGLLTPPGLPAFLHGHLEEAGMVDAVFCREAFRLASQTGDHFALDRWVEINDRLSALKPARESRAGSAALGRYFAAAVLGVADASLLREASEASRRARGMIHHCTAFGLTAGILGIEGERAVVGYLHQVSAGLVSACQRLLPVGQSEATRILWNLKPAMIETARRSRDCKIDDVSCFMPLLDWGAMEHPALSTRLFIS
jgi:urease accessory protein